MVVIPNYVALVYIDRQVFSHLLTIIPAEHRLNSVVKTIASHLDIPFDKISKIEFYSISPENYQSTARFLPPQETPNVWRYV